MVNSNSQARAAVIQALYQYDVAKSEAHDLESIIGQFLANPANKNIRKKFFRESFEYIGNNFASLDAILIPLLDIKLEQLDIIERAILRLAIYELTQTEVKDKIIVNEAIELAKKFANSEGYKYINGVLDKFMQK